MHTNGVLLFLRQLLHYDPNAGQVSGISACFNSSGSHLLALRRRLPPVLYATQNENALCQFYHPNYYNSCTMKTCSFAGANDEYILSGSDDFNLYMWGIPVDNCKYISSLIDCRHVWVEDYLLGYFCEPLLHL